MDILSIVWEVYSPKCPQKEFVNYTMLRCHILEKILNKQI